MEEIARPAKYADWIKPENLTRVTLWAAEYAKNKDVAKAIGISYETFCRWSERFPEFSDAIKEGRRLRAVDLEKKMHDMAMGGTIEEITDFEEVYDQESGTWVPKSRHRRIKKIPPNPALVIFEAKNRLGYADNPNKETDDSQADEFLRAWRDDDD